MRYRVLLVEDDDDLRALYGFYLANSGFRVKAVRNGLEALTELQSYIPDVIVTDLAMPIIDGISLIRMIKARKEFAATPVIAITAFGKQLQKLAISAGANLTVDKPENIQAFCEIVTSVLP